MTVQGLDAYRATVVGLASPLEPLPLAIADAVGCIAAADVAAPALPAAAVAAWDGFAVAASDTATASPDLPLRLPVTHDVTPGLLAGALVPGAAVRVASGAELPSGADAVVAAEHADASSVTVDQPVGPGIGVVPAGAQLSQDAAIVRAGALIGIGQVAALAAAGIRAVRVRPALRVAILAVGSELSDAAIPGSGRPPGAVRVREASTSLLRALVVGESARVSRVAVVPDDAARLREAFADALMDAELIITTGGLSQDHADVLVPVLRQACGLELVSVALAPGGMHGFGVASDERGRSVIVLALPGHPVAVAAAFAGYVRDVLAAMRGVHAPLASAPSTVAYPRDPQRSLAVPVAHADGVATPLGVPGSPTLADLAAAHGIALLEPGTQQVLPGQRLHVAWWRA